MINRSAITVCVKQPFLDWLRNLPDPVGRDSSLDEINEEPNIYLLPEYGVIAEQEMMLKQYFDIIFDIELASWWTDERDWPKPRTIKLFNKWFDIKFHSIIEDLTDEPLIDED